MTIYHVIDKQEPSSKFFVSSGLDDWSLESHEELLRIEEYLKTHPDCNLIATEFLGGEHDD